MVSSWYFRIVSDGYSSNTYYLFFSLLYLKYFFVTVILLQLKKLVCAFTFVSFTFVCFYVLKREKKFACLFKYNTCFCAPKWQMGRFCDSAKLITELWCNILWVVMNCKNERGFWRVFSSYIYEIVQTALKWFRKKSSIEEALCLLTRIFFLKKLNQIQAMKICIKLWHV